MAMPGMDGRMSRGLLPIIVAQYSNHALTAFTGGGWEMEVAVRTRSSSSGSRRRHTYLVETTLATFMQMTRMQDTWFMKQVARGDRW